MRLLVNDLDDDSFYLSLISFLNDVKLTLGGDGLNSTLRRHPRLKSYLVEHQKKQLKSFEDYLS